MRQLGIALALSIVLQPAAASRAWAATPTPQPTISLTPNCGPVAGPAAVAQTYAIRVVGSGFDPNLDLLTIYFNPGPSQQSFQAYQDSKGNLDTTIHPTRVQAGTYQVAVYFTSIPQATAQFTVPCPPTPPPTPTPTPLVTPSTPPSRPGSPTLTLTPSVGPPGTVVVASGAGFPANGQVQLAWSQGILNPLLATVPTDLNGSFSQQVLIFPHDELGSRMLTATSIDVPSAPALASAPFLVVPGELQPRDFSSRR